MQAIILAAGMGRRLGEYTQDQTKCMVEVNGERLIDRMLGQLSSLGLTRVVIVTGYCGAALRAHIGTRYDDRLRKIFRESVTSYAAAQNIVVIKTLPGLANGAAGTLDSMNVTDLVGTLAGDDTALLVMKTNAAAEALCEEIKKML